jgi:hypothetical protein
VKKTFYVVTDRYDKPFAAFADLLPALRHVDGLMMEAYTKDESPEISVWAVWSESPAEAVYGRFFENRYLEVYNSHLAERGDFPEEDFDQKTFFVVYDEQTDETFGVFPELLDAADLWNHLIEDDEKRDLKQPLHLAAVYAGRPPEDAFEIRPYLLILGSDRDVPGFDIHRKAMTRVASRIRRGGWPTTKDWSPSGKFPRHPGRI